MTKQEHTQNESMSLCVTKLLMLLQCASLPPDPCWGALDEGTEPLIAHSNMWPPTNACLSLMCVHVCEKMEFQLKSAVWELLGSFLPDNSILAWMNSFNHLKTWPCSLSFICRQSHLYFLSSCTESYNCGVKCKFVAQVNHFFSFVSMESHRI